MLQQWNGDCDRVPAPSSAAMFLRQSGFFIREKVKREPLRVRWPRSASRLRRPRQ